MEIKEVKFSNVLKRGIATVRELNGKPYEVHYTYGKLSDNYKVADYGVDFKVNINGENYGLLVPMGKSVVDSEDTDNVIKLAFDVFKDSFRFTLKSLKNK